MVYLGPVGSWETNPFTPPKQERYSGPPLAVRTCAYCGKPVPVTRTTCENCGAPSATDAPQVTQAAQDTDALFRSIDVAELVQHPATITVNRERSNTICWHDLVTMVECLELTDSGVWLISRTAIGDISRIQTGTGERPFPLVTAAPVQLFGYPLCWSAQSSHIGEVGDVALVDWHIYHRLSGGWPSEPTLYGKVYQISPFVVLGESQ